MLDTMEELQYIQKAFSNSQSNSWLDQLLSTVAWRRDVVNMFGKRIETKRKVAWYADEPYTYSYSGTAHQAIAWNKELLEIKAQVEKLAQTTFNCCLLNLYHSGNEGMGWHRDNETCMDQNSPIASVSIGARRKFKFRKKDRSSSYDLWLESGSLLIMAAGMQDEWEHCLPPTKKIDEHRINLTFRNWIDPNG